MRLCALVAISQHRSNAPRGLPCQHVHYFAERAQDLFFNRTGLSRSLPNLSAVTARAR
jgi:hypothetical protein